MADRVVDDRFRLVSVIGSGGAATVHRAVDQKDKDRSVAVKIFEGHRSGGGTEEVERQLMRFRKEASLLASMENSPYVARHIADGVSPDGENYIAMELIAGKTLRRLIQRHGDGIEVPLFLTIADQVVNGLLSIHSRRVLHRDLCPDNIMLLPPEENRVFVKFLDFGLGRFMQGETERVTKGGTLFGKPSYLSPEVSRGEPQSADSDVYSLGVVLYEMLTATLPIEVTSFAELPSVRRQAPVPLTNHEVSRQIPAALRALIMGCLEKQRENRPTLDEMHECLQELLRQQQGGVDLVEEFANWELSQVSVVEGENPPQFLEPGTTFGSFVVESPRRIEFDHELWSCKDSRDGSRHEVLVFPKTQSDIDHRLVVARQAMEVQHENLEPIKDVLATGSLGFIVTALTEAQSLEQAIDEEGSMGSSRILQISEGILQGLRALHRRKKPIIHGALSPRNILMDEFDHVSLTYPGFALGDGSIDPFALEAGPFAYRAPEASLGDAATARSDVFSFGCVLWFMLCGQPPAGGSVLRAIYTHAEGQQVLPNPTELHPRAKDLLSLATHCLNKDQARRPRSTGTVVRALNVIFES